MRPPDAPPPRVPTPASATALEPPALPDAACVVAQTDAAKLVYVRLGDALLHVREFRGCGEAERRGAVCPACASPVTIRLGERRVWHAAHRPGGGSTCPATAGETALHLNAKIALRDALLAHARDGVGRGQPGRGVAAPLDLALACAADDACPIPARREWPVAWDDVAVECRVGVHQPDLVLFRDGRAVGALEVLVTHAVTAEKAAALRALGVPWLEVEAGAVVGAEAWTAARPLPVRRASRDVARWRCPRHEAQRMLAEARAAYHALKDRRGPEAAELVARGQTLRDMETETRRLVAEAEDLRARVADEAAGTRRRLAELPRQIAEAERRLAVARQDLELAERAAHERRERHAVDAGRATALARDLRRLDDDLSRHEGLRRALSGMHLGGPSHGPHLVDAGRRTLFWAAVDVYRAPGAAGRPTTSRGLFTVELVAVDGKGTELWLVEDGGRRLHRIEADDEAAEPILFAALERRLAEWRGHGRARGVLVDRPSEWRRVPPERGVPENWWDGDNGPVPRAYRWDDETRRWVLRVRADAPDALAGAAERPAADV